MTQIRDDEDIRNSGWNPPHELWLDVMSYDFDSAPSVAFLWVKNKNKDRVLGPVRKDSLKDEEVSGKEFLIKKGFLQFQVASKVLTNVINNEIKDIKQEEVNAKKEELIEGIKVIYQCSNGQLFDDPLEAESTQKEINANEKYGQYSKESLIVILKNIEEGIRKEAEYCYSFAEKYNGGIGADHDRYMRHKERGNRLMELIR